MRVDDQGVREPGRQRFQAIPRTLVFLTSVNPLTGQREVLLLKGAATKRLWANRYNGLGGHVEADEDVHAAALREILEETGLKVTSLTLRGVVNIDAGRDEAGPRPGVMIFVFLGNSPQRTVSPTAEGAPEWIAVEQLDDYPLVDDLYELIPRTLAGGPVFFAHYSPGADGKMVYRFNNES